MDRVQSIDFPREMGSPGRRVTVSAAPGIYDPGQGEANSRIPVRPDLLEKPGGLLTTHTVVNMPVGDL